jgi:hypothetical protein
MTYFYSGTLRTFQHIFNSYCQHHSCRQNVHGTRDITPHTNVPSLQHSLVHYTRTTRIHSLLPYFTLQSNNVGALCVLCITESHPFHRLMGQGPLMLVCLHALAVHSPHSRGSISVPLLPLSNLGASVTPTLPLHGVSVLWARGHTISR